MKKLILTFAAILLGSLLFSSCDKETVWVSYKATVSGEFPMEALAVQAKMNEEIEKSLSGYNQGLYPESKANDEAAIAACDKIYEPVAHGATQDFTILLNKSYPSSDPNNIKTVTLKTYKFTTK
jgi:pyruvate kinase